MDLTLQAKTKLMGLFSNDIVTFDDLFLHQLQDVYYAENQITKALPKMIDKTTAPALRAGFETHLRETEGQIARLERIFDLLGEKAKAITCPAIDGIIKEANEVAGEIEQGGAGRRADRVGAGGRALRDHALRNADRVGRAARAAGDRLDPPGDAGRGVRYRRQTDRDGEVVREPEGRGGRRGVMMLPTRHSCRIGNLTPDLAA